MRRPGSLLARLTWWFAASLLALYGISASLVYLYAAAQAHQYAVLTLKNEAETLASRLADSASLDAPELKAPERDPFPMWMRVRRNGHLLAETPGSPEIPLEALEPEERGEVVSVSVVTGAASYMIVRHQVGGRRADLYVEAIGSLASLNHDRQRLGMGLLLVGLVVIPLAVLGGRGLARRALRPIQDLVVAITRIDPGRLRGRTQLPEGGVEEVAVLSRTFNALLGRLEESFERMRRFTADASHEIRNPLSVLRTGLEISLRRERSPREYQDLLRENLQEIERLQAVVEGLLLLARDSAESELLSIARLPVDLGEVVRATSAFFTAYAGESDIRIEAAVEPGLIVTGDAGLLRLVVFNLLDNALRHNPAGESVRVEARRRNGGALLVVADSGPGIAPEDRERVFERFYRGGPTSSKGVGGIGLSVVRWVAEAHGGTVRLLDSVRGAAFEVVLPPSAPTPAPSASRPRE